MPIVLVVEGYEDQRKPTPPVSCLRRRRQRLKEGGE
jgi:hypothetical protein